MKNRVLAGLLAVCCVLGLFTVIDRKAAAQVYSGLFFVQFQNYALGTQTFTATSQTGAAITVPVGASAGTVSVVGTALTTATFAVSGSNDGGVTYNPLAMAVISVPGTVAATETVTTNQTIAFNVAGMDHIKYITSGTFTATNIKLTTKISGNKGVL